MKHVAVGTVICFLAFGLASSAGAATRQASVGNYWYEEDVQRDQTKITVRQGDQITFTVREASVPGHTVDVDPLNIHSPNLAVGQTYTTPPLNRPGNFYLYCRPHEQRGHHTRLIVVAATQRTAAPTSRPASRRSAPPAAAPARTTPTPAATRAPARTPAPTATLAPIGVGTAPPESLDRPVPTDPNSLDALTGRVRAGGVPWTRSLWWLAFAAVPIIGAGAVALQRARIAEYQPKVENLRRARAAASKPQSAGRKATSKKPKPTPRRRKP